MLPPFTECFALTPPYKYKVLVIRKSLNMNSKLRRLPSSHTRIYGSFLDLRPILPAERSLWYAGFEINHQWSAAYRQAFLRSNASLCALLADKFNVSKPLRDSEFQKLR